VVAIFSSFIRHRDRWQLTHNRVCVCVCVCVCWRECLQRTDLMVPQATSEVRKSQREGLNCPLANVRGQEQKD